MTKYKISLQRKDEDKPAYVISAEAETESIAIYEAKKFVAVHGCWSNVSTIDERIDMLSVANIEIFK